MARRKPVEVTVVIDGRELTAGTLWFHERGGQTPSFRYAGSYLKSPGSYALDPVVLPKEAGVFHTAPGWAMFSAFADSAPDHWGEKLMRLGERERARGAAVEPRTLGQADFLLGARDDTRQGAIRFRQPWDGSYYSAHRNAVPQLSEVPRLLRAAERLEAGDTFDPDIADLIDAGSSLGGAQPKAAVTDASGGLTIAKFPRSSDEWDAPAWEEVQLRLARRAGLTVAESELLPVAGRHVLLVRRFDRQHGHRIGFVSALTMLEGRSGEQRSYLGIGEVIERYSPRADADLRELYARMIFSILTANTDNHLRNHAFLREREGWALSPAYDLNPNPVNPGQLNLGIDSDVSHTSIETAISVSGHFRLPAAEARTIVGDIERATSHWRDEAAALGLPSQQIDRLADAYETEQRQVARSVTSTRPTE